MNAHGIRKFLQAFVSERFHKRVVKFRQVLFFCFLRLFRRLLWGGAKLHFRYPGAFAPKMRERLAILFFGNIGCRALTTVGTAYFFVVGKFYVREKLCTSEKH